MSVNMGTAVGYLDIDTTGFTSGMRDAMSSLSQLVNRSNGLSDRFRALGNVLGKTGKTLSASLTVPLIGVATAAVKVGSDFDKAMSQLAATMNKPVDQIGKLRDTAIKMGSETSFSATQAAEGLNYLAMAGYKSGLQMKSLPVILNAANAGNMELGKTSEMVTQIMNSYGLKVDSTKKTVANMTDLTNKMAVAASSAGTDYDQLGTGMLTVGSTATTLKGGVDEVAAAMGILADNSLLGAEGGTALRNVIVNLTPTTKPAAEAMEKLGVSAYDSNGKFRPLKDTFGDMQKALAGYTQEEQQMIKTQIFGREGLTAANALLKTSAERWDELEEALSHANDGIGAAANMAATQMDNLEGDVIIFQSALEGAGIVISDILTPALRSIVKTATKVVSAFNKMDESTQKMIVKIAGIAAAIGPVLIILGKMSAAVAGMIDWFGRFGPVVSTAIAYVNNAFAGVIATITGFGASISGAFGTVIIAIQSAFQVFGGWLTGFFGSLTAPIVTAVSGIVSSIVAPFAGIAAQIGAFMAPIVGVVTSVVGTITAPFVSMITTITGLFGTLGGTAIGAFTSMLGSVFGVIAALTPMIAIIASIASVIAGAKYAWDENVNGMRDTISNIVESVKTILQGVVDFFTGIASSIKTAWDSDVGGIRTIVADMVTAVVELVDQVLTTAIDVASQIKAAWDSDFGGIRTFVTEVIGGIVDVFGTIVSVVTDVVKAVSALFSGDWSAALELGKSAAGKLWEGVRQFFKDGWKNVKELVKNIGPVIKENFEKAKKHAVEKAKELWKGAKEKFKDTVDYAKEHFPEMVQAAKEKFGEVAKKAREKFKDVADYAKKHFPEAVQAAKEKFKDIADHAKKNFKKAAEYAKEHFPEIVKKAREKFGDLVEVAKEKLPKFAKNVKDGAKDAVKGFGEKLKNLPENAGKWFGKVIAKAVNFIAKFAPKAVKAGSEFLKNIVKWLQKVPGKVGNLLGKVLAKAVKFVINFPKEAVKAAKKFLNKLTGGMDDAPKSMGEIAAAIIEAVSHLPGEMLQLGIDLVQGIIDGIGQMLGGAIQAAKDFCGGLVEGFKENLKISSPSKIGRDEIGAQLAQGIIDGVLSKKENAKKSAEELSKTMVAAAKNGISSYKEVYNLTAAQQAEYWKKVVDATKGGTMANLEAQAQYSKSSKAIQEEIEKNEMNYFKAREKQWKTLNTKGERSAKQEMKFWKETLSHLSEGSSAYIKAFEKYKKAVEKSEKDYVAKREQRWNELNQDGDKTARQEEKFWQKTLDNLTKGTSTYSKVYKKWVSAHQKVAEERLQKYEKTLEDEKLFHDVSAKEETKYWKKRLKNFEKGSEQYEEAYRKYIESKKRIPEEELSQYEKILEDEKVIRDVSAREEAEYWKQYLYTFEKGSTEAQEVYKKYIESKKNVQQEELDAAQKRLDDYSVYNEVSLAQEMDYWDSQRQLFEEGTEQRIEADQKYLEKKKEYESQLMQIEENYAEESKKINEQMLADIEAIHKAYEEAITQRQEAITSQFQLFEAYSNETEITGATLIENLSSQVQALHKWRYGLEDLENRAILPAGLVSEIRDLGVNASNQIQALNSLSDEELQTYAELWEEKMRTAKEEATRELEEMKTNMENEEKQIISQAQNDLQQLNNTYQQQLTELGVNSTPLAIEAGEKVSGGIAIGLQNKKGEIVSVLSDITSEMRSTMSEVASLASQIAAAAARARSEAASARAAASSASKTSKTSGSHATGLDTVPHDNYIANLHRGEMVLTKQQADEYNRNRNGISMVNNFYGTKPLDERETARQFTLAQKRLALNW